MRPQAAALSQVVQEQAHEEADVERIKAGVSQAAGAAAAALASLGSLEERCSVRLQYASQQDADGYQAELRAVQEVREAWRQLAMAAAEREVQGIQLPLAAVSSLGGSQGSGASEGAPSRGSSPSRRPSSLRLARSGSTASVASSGSRQRQSRGPSRAAKEAAG